MVIKQYKQAKKENMEMIKVGNEFLDRSYTCNISSIHQQGVDQLERITAKLISDFPFQRGPAGQNSYSNNEEAKNKYNTGMGQNNRMTREIKTYREIHEYTNETKLKYPNSQPAPYVIPEVKYNVIHIRYNETADKDQETRSGKHSQKDYEMDLSKFMLVSLKKEIYQQVRKCLTTLPFDKEELIQIYGGL